VIEECNTKHQGSNGVGRLNQWSKLDYSEEDYCVNLSQGCINTEDEGPVRGDVSLTLSNMDSINSGNLSGRSR
jgi:hypothetical protein